MTDQLFCRLLYRCDLTTTQSQQSSIPNISQLETAYISLCGHMSDEIYNNRLSWIHTIHHQIQFRLDAHCMNSTLSCQLVHAHQSCAYYGMVVSAYCYTTHDNCSMIISSVITLRKTNKCDLSASQGVDGCIQHFHTASYACMHLRVCSTHCVQPFLF